MVVDSRRQYAEWRKGTVPVRGECCVDVIESKG